MLPTQLFQNHAPDIQGPELDELLVCLYDTCRINYEGGDHRTFVKGGEKVYHCGGGIVYHRHDEKELNWEPGGVRSGAVSAVLELVRSLPARPRPGRRCSAG